MSLIKNPAGSLDHFSLDQKMLNPYWSMIVSLFFTLPYGSLSLFEYSRAVIEDVARWKTCVHVCVCVCVLLMSHLSRWFS